MAVAFVPLSVLTAPLFRPYLFVYFGSSHPLCGHRFLRSVHSPSPPFAIRAEIPIARTLSRCGGDTAEENAACRCGVEQQKS